VKREYLLKDPTQPFGHNFPRKLCGGTRDYRSFCGTWLKKHDWLEYSVAKDVACCFYCFLFKPTYSVGQHGYDVFTKLGFQTWKNAYKAFPLHVGGLDSFHSNSRKACDDFKNQSSSVSHGFRNYNKESEIKYKFPLTAALNYARYLLMQGLSFRAHDESASSLSFVK
jgi:hypothetical protein